MKHWRKRNYIKMYDKGSVLRVETTINNPREFKVLKVVATSDGQNFWRYFQVGTQANHRYLDALALCTTKRRGCPSPG